MIKKDSSVYETKLNPYENRNSNPYERKSNRFDPAMIMSQYVQENEEEKNESLVYSRTPVETKRNP